MANEQPNKAVQAIPEGDIEAAIAAGTAIGDPKVNPHEHGPAYAIIPLGHKIEYIERPKYPPRRSGTVKLSDTASFLEYWRRQSEPISYIYGSMVPAQFLAVFDEHAKGDSGVATRVTPTTTALGKDCQPIERSEGQSIGGPNWRDHRALYTLQHSDEWATWMARNGKPFEGNEAFAIWLEENLLDILSPDPATFMDIALNMRVRQGQVFGKRVNLKNGAINLEYHNTVDGSGGSSPTGESLAIPEKFEISIPVFAGIDSPRYTVEARFRYRLNGGALSLRYDLVRPAKVVEEAFKVMLEEIEGATGIKVLWGTPN